MTTRRFLDTNVLLYSIRQRVDETVKRSPLRKRTRLMPWWAWLGGAVISIWSAFQLWRAWALGRINGGVVDYDRAEYPIMFWGQVGLAVLVIFVFGFVSVAAAVGAIDVISN